MPPTDANWFASDNLGERHFFLDQPNAKRREQSRIINFDCEFVNDAIVIRNTAGGTQGAPERRRPVRNRTDPNQNRSAEQAQITK